jgi:hypothetical protein
MVEHVTVAHDTRVRFSSVTPIRRISMKFVILLTGSGVGCDHAIDCNKTWQIVEKPTIDEAISDLKNLLNKQYPADSDFSLDSVKIFVVNSEINFNVKEFYAKILDERKAKTEVSKEAKERAELERLKKKYK